MELEETVARLTSKLQAEVQDVKFHLTEAEGRYADLKKENAALKDRLNNQVSVEDLSNQIQRLKLQSEHTERERSQVTDENDRLKEEISFVSTRSGSNCPWSLEELISCAENKFLVPDKNG